MNDLEIKPIPVYSKIIKISNDYYIKYDYRNIILLNSSLERISFLEFKNSSLKVFLLNDGKIIAVSYHLITIFKVENKDFKKIQETTHEDIFSPREIIELKNNKIVILDDKILITLKKENEEYKIEHIINVEFLSSQIEYIMDNKILLLENGNLYSLDFSEDNFKKQKLNLNLNISQKHKCMFKIKNDIIIFVVDDYLHFYNLKNEEVISVYEMDERMTDLINFKDDSYLCCFPRLKKIFLTTFDNEFIIKDSRSYDYARTIGKIYLVNNKLFII